MVAHTPTALPTLSPEDQSLLLRYFAASEDPAALTPLGTRDSALSTSPPSLLSLYSFLSRPDIAAWVAFHREHQAHLQRQLALNQLAAVCKSSPNPIEQRRAATTLLRGLTSRSTPKSKRVPDPSPTPTPDHTTPRHPQNVRTQDSPPPSTQQHLQPSNLPDTLPNPLPAAKLRPSSPISQLLSLQGTLNPRPSRHPATLQHDSS